MSNPKAYLDVIPLLDTAVMHDEPIQFVVKGWGRAVNVRQRCYRLRAALLKQKEEMLGNVPGLPADTPYDNIKISIVDSNGNKITKGSPENKDDHFTLVFEQNKLADGVLLDSAGNPIDFEPPQSANSLVDPAYDEFDISDLGLDIAIDEE